MKHRKGLYVSNCECGECEQYRKAISLGRNQGNALQKQITYVYRGRIERGADYRWCDGYSQDSAEGFVTYPWMTMRECQADAKAKGCKAIFYTPPGPGAKRFEPEVIG